MIEASAEEKPYINPYLGGFGIGSVIFFSFLFVGKGLGASGALTRLFTFSLDTIAPTYTRSQIYLQKYVDGLDNWLVYMFIGIVVGAAFAGIRQKRMSSQILKGPRTTSRRRLVGALIGGVLMALGARLAGGCASGLALTGAGALGVAGWVFFLAIFATGLPTAYLIRREWL